MKRPFVAVAALTVLALLGMAGCGLDRAHPNRSHYVLEAVPRDPIPPRSPLRVIQISRARVTPPFSSRALQYHVAPNRQEPSYYHNWAADPGALVTAAATEVLAATGVFAVVTPGSGAEGGEVLELDVTALYADVTGPTPTAVIALRATLLDDAGIVLLSRELARDEPAASRAEPDMVQAWNAALDALLTQLTDELVRVTP